MFGQSTVQDAFKRYIEAHWDWVASEQARQDAFDRNKDAIARQALDELNSSEEITRLRNARAALNQITEARHQDLRDAVQTAIHRVPKPTRWSRRPL